jgi:hypothetical protein
MNPARWNWPLPESLIQMAVIGEMGDGVPAGPTRGMQLAGDLNRPAAAGDFT